MMKVARFNKGFTLMEMAIVLVIVGLLLSSLLLPLSKQREMSNFYQTKKSLEEIKEALIGYAMINGRLPCPTTYKDPGQNEYGHAIDNCLLNTQDPELPPFAVTGFLPWKDLSVREVDAWGLPRKKEDKLWSGYWIYRVAPEFASNALFFTLATASSTANIDIVNSSGVSLTTSGERPVAVICSMGADGVANGQNALFETTNPIYQSDEVTATFDDICVWIGRPTLFNRMVQAGKLP
jgi:prepilin-type N-terminal cleavage/methylation domain-containing protein